MPSSRVGIPAKQFDFLFHFFLLNFKRRLRPMLHFLPASILAQTMLMSSTSVSLSLPRSQMMRMDLPELIVLDVGHGNCALVRDIHGTIIIDCPLGSTLMKTLRQLNIREIASVLLSHADEDHIGGVMNL